MGLMKSLRDKTHIVMLILVLSFIALMVFEWGMDLGGMGGGGSNTVGKVNGEQISYEQIQGEYNQLLDFERQQRGGEVDEFTTRRLLRQVWDRRVSFMLLQQEVVKHNITVSDAELLESIRENPPDYIMQQEIFLTDGQFDRAKYLAALNDPNIQGWEMLEAQFRALLPQQKLIERVTGSARVTDLEVKNAYIAQNEKVKVKYIGFTANDFTADSIAVSDEEIKSYYDAHKEDYEQDARVNMEYIKIDRKPSEADEQRVERQANDLYKQLTEGADFETLAKEFSEDGSAQNGGDLGFFGRGTMIKEFEEVAFQSPIGTVAQPVKTVFGWHIIKVEEKKQEDGTDQVRARHILLKTATGQATLRSLREKGEMLLEKAKEDGLQTAINTVPNDSLKVQETGLFTRRDDGFIPRLGYLIGATSFAFDSDIGAYSDVIENDSGFHILHVTEKKPEGLQALDEVESQIRSLLVIKGREEKARQAAQAVKVQINGNNLDNLTGTEKEKVQEVDAFARQGFVPGIGQDFAFIDAAFRLSSTGELSDIVEGERGFYLIQLMDKEAIDDATFDTQKELLHQQLLGQKQNQLYSEWLAQLREDADIEDHMSDFFVF